MTSPIDTAELRRIYQNAIKIKKEITREKILLTQKEAEREMINEENKLKSRATIRLSSSAETENETLHTLIENLMGNLKSACAGTEPNNYTLIPIHCDKKALLKLNGDYFEQKTLKPFLLLWLIFSPIIYFLFTTHCTMDKAAPIALSSISIAMLFSFIVSMAIFLLFHRKSLLADFSSPAVKHFVEHCRSQGLKVSFVNNEFLKISI